MVTDNGTTNGVADPKPTPATVDVTVTEVNDAPVAADDTRVAEDSGGDVIASTSRRVNDTNGSGQRVRPRR